MEPWQIWLIAALLFFIIEIFTSGFAVACFSVGAIGSAIADAVGLGYIWQIIIFAVISVLALIFIRPIVNKIFYRKKETLTNADALIGKRGRVSEEINNDTGKGRVSIDGDEWKAVSCNGSIIEKGSQVTIVSRESIIVTVVKN